MGSVTALEAASTLAEEQARTAAAATEGALGAFQETSLGDKPADLEADRLFKVWQAAERAWRTESIKKTPDQRALGDLRRSADAAWLDYRIAQDKALREKERDRQAALAKAEADARFQAEAVEAQRKATEAALAARQREIEAQQISQANATLQKIVETRQAIEAEKAAEESKTGSTTARKVITAGLLLSPAWLPMLLVRRR